MLKNYLKIALRNLRRQKGYAFINVFGLAVGMAVCLLIVLFIQEERSYDEFHEKADRIYRVHIASGEGNQRSVSKRIPEPVVAQMYGDLPEVEAFVKVAESYGEILITANDQQRYEDAFMQAGPAFFDVFSYEAIAGNLDTALDEPGSVVLTESAAHIYFGEEDPLGQVLSVVSRNEANYTVRAVIEDVPGNAHLQFSMVAHRPDRDQPRWNYYMTGGYVLLREDADLAALEAKLPDFVEQNAYYDHPRENLPSLMLQLVTTMHLYPEWEKESAGMGPVQYLYLFGGVALLILLIACINFMNLATARSATRAREVGVRKTVGAGRGQLIFQFLSESVLMSMLALV
ncbi:MAG TPA: ABC transporter permease, partial [Rhodothermales bacterium]|nr:ABC transporter permease [Rhodothermales bacterium]